MTARGRASVPLLFGAALVVLAVAAVIVVSVTVPRAETPERAARSIVDALERDDYAAFYARLGPGDRERDQLIPVPETAGRRPELVILSAKAYLGLAPGAQPNYVVRQRFPQRARIEVLNTHRRIAIIPTTPRMILVREGDGPWQWEFIESLGDEVGELQGMGHDAVAAVIQMMNALPLEEITKSLGWKQEPPPALPAEEKPDARHPKRDSQ